MLFNICLFFVITVSIAHAIITPLFRQPWFPEPNLQQSWMPWIWMDLFRANVEYTKVNGSNINLLFYGDSITAGWMDKEIWNRTYAPLGAANYGIAGDRTQNIHWRIRNGEVDNISPRLIVLLIGTVNLKFNTDADIARGFIKIIDELQIRLPTSKILVLGILPRANVKTTAMIDRINANYSLTDNGKTIRYLNMKDAFYAENGTFLPGLWTSDLIHLTPAGYAKWEATMKPLFSEMWNAP